MYDKVNYSIPAIIERCCVPFRDYILVSTEYVLDICETIARKKSYKVYDHNLGGLMHGCSNITPCPNFWLELYDWNLPSVLCGAPYKFRYAPFLDVPMIPQKVSVRISGALHRHNATAYDQSIEQPKQFSLITCLNLLIFTG